MSGVGLAATAGDLKIELETAAAGSAGRIDAATFG